MTNPCQAVLDRIDEFHSELSTRLDAIAAATPKSKSVPIRRSAEDHRRAGASLVLASLISCAIGFFVGRFLS